MIVQPKTCLVYDPTCLEHIPHYAIESPQRVVAIQQRLSTLGLTILPSRTATADDILRCHSISYLRLATREISTSTETETEQINYTMLSTGDTLVCQKSLIAAYRAAGGVLAAIDAVMTGEAKNVFCNVRPPGHHAGIGEGMGFCIFNNVAIGAKYVQTVHKIQRVLIVDWDVHPGNGTQNIFHGNRSVYNFGFHQEGIYLEDACAEPQVENKKRRMTTTNYSIKRTRQARTDIMKLFKNDLQEKMKSFKPEFILISSGFDARENDTLGRLNLTDADYAEMTRSVMDIANIYCKGRIVSVLEGGYNIEGTASAAYAHVKTLSEG